MINFQESDQQKDNLWWREYNLQLTKWCLEKYKETQNEEYYNWAKVFGEWSKLIKEKYL